MVHPLDAPLTYRLVRSDFECLLDLKSGRSSACVAPSLYAFDALLRVMLTLVLSGERGFLLHSAGLMQDGQAHVFFGVSGAGKTTVTRLSGGPAILSDELVAVRRDGEGFRAYGTPFSGEMGHPGDATSGPIAAIYRLGRPPGPIRQQISPAVVARSLLRSVLYFGGSQRETDAILSTCIDLASSVPCYHLRLRLESPFWEQLNGLE